MSILPIPSVSSSMPVETDAAASAYIPEQIPIMTGSQVISSPPSVAVKTSFHSVNKTPSSSANASLKNTKSLSNVSYATTEKPSNGYKPGKVVWNIPGPIQVKQMATIEVRLTLDPERFAGLANRITADGTIATEEADFGDSLTATLTSAKDAINIESNMKEHQDVVKGMDAQWAWHIYPKQEGNLTLTLTIVSKVRGKERSDIFIRNIYVHAIPPPSLLEKILAFLRTDWEAVSTIILIPMAGWFYRTYSKRRRQKN